VRVPLLDLTRQHGRVGEAVASRVTAVFESQQFILGRSVAEFEQAFCDFTGCAHAVGMSSGTDAQLAILMAMGIGPGDAVITTPYTFFATAGCIHRVGAEPVFVDIRADTLHMSAQKLRECLERFARAADGSLLTLRGNRVRAVIPVHLFGACCDLDALEEAAALFGLPIVEDAAQAIGSEYAGKKGQAARAGTFGESAFFSFFPTKNLGAAGDAGMAVCHSAEMAEKLRGVRNHGMEQQYRHRTVGGNFRLDAIQAAVLQAKLPLVEEWNAARRRNADAYRAGLGEVFDFVQVPAEPWKTGGLKNHHTYHQYVIRAKRRDELLRHLTTAEIGHAVYYPLPLHLQECFAFLGHKPGDFPEAERAAQETLALPIFPELEAEEIAAVCAAIASFYRG
jgi:dTDP-4-amino-4,6-dideoxygalactose transaminase